MAVNKNALIRYKTLDKCFSNRYRQFYIQDLINECSNVLSEYYGEDFSVSRRQIFDDITFMKSDAGYQAPIVSVKEGRKVFYRYDDLTFSILHKPLTNEEQMALENTVELLSRIKGIPGLIALESLQTKLIDVKNNHIADRNIISFEENEFLVGLEYLVPLYNYIKNEQTLNINYQAFKYNEQHTYLISPYHLKQYNNRWFLFGWNHESKFLQNLALDRIKSLALTTEKYQDLLIDFDEYFEDIVGVTNDNTKEVFDIKIQLSESIIPYIKSKPLHGSQKINQNILQLKVKLNYELISLIFSYAENMKVREPQELVDILNDKMNKMLNK